MLHVPTPALANASATIPDDIALQSLAEAMGEPTGTAVPVTPPPPTLTALIAQLDAAEADFSVKCRLSDSVALGREPTAEEEASYEISSNAANAALEAVIDYPARDLAELHIKSEALVKNDWRKLTDDMTREALARDIARLAGEQPNPPSPHAGWDAWLEDAIPAEIAAHDAYNAVSDRVEAEVKAAMGDRTITGDDLIALYEGAEERAELNAAQKAHTNTLEALSDIEECVLSAPVHTFADLRPILRLVLHWEEPDDDAPLVNHLIAEVARLFGMNEKADAFAFNPFKWTDRFEATGAYVVRTDQPELGAYIPAPRFGDRETAMAMLDALTDVQMHRLRSITPLAGSEADASRHDRRRERLASLRDAA